MKARVCDDVTPLDLLEFKERGFAVFRTAHVGNQYPSNLFLAAIGIPVAQFDRTVFAKDSNYHPAVEIQGGWQKRILDDGQDGLLVPYGTSYGEKTPAQHHYQVFKSLFPTLVYTDSECLLGTARDRVEKLIEFIASKYPASFDRYVLPCGCMVTLYIDGAVCLAHGCQHSPKVVFSTADLGGRAVQLLEELVQLVTREGSVTKKHGGAVPRLSLLFVIQLMTSFWMTDHDHVFDLSGPDMVRYTFGGDFLWDLKNMWARAMKAPIAKNVPGLTFEVVPTADFRFGGLVAEKPTFLDAVEELFCLQDRKRNSLPLPHEQGMSQVDHAERKRIAGEINTRLQEVLESLPGLPCDIAYDIARADFFTQHDLTLAGAKLKVPDAYMSMTFRDMGIRFNRLKNLLTK